MPRTRGGARHPACAIALLSALLTLARPARATPHAGSPPDPTPGALERTRAGPLPDYVVRPRSSEATPRPVTLYLHGLCGEPSNGCRYFREGVIERSWLLCPSAPVACPGGGATWTAPPGAQRAAFSRALSAVEQRAPARIDRAGAGVLIGFSQGAYVARSLLRTWRGRFRGVAFIGAYVTVTRAELEASGVRRVVFAAGRYDQTHAALVAAAQRLAREGFPVRFLDLGPVGHTYAPGRGSAGWRDALAWLEED